MDTGNNGQMLALNIESIAEVKVLTQGYQAEFGRSSGLQITAVTKSGTNRFRGIGLRPHHQLRLEHQPQAERAERRPEAGRPNRRRSATRSAVPSGSRAAATSCSSSTATNTARRTRRSTTATRSACASRPRSSAPATSRRRWTTTARCSTSSRIRARRRVQRDRSDRVLPRWRRARQDSGGSSLSDGRRDPESLSAAESRADRRARTTTTSSAARSPPLPVVKNLVQQPAIRLDYQLSSKLRVTAKYSGQRQRVLTRPG